MNPVVKVCGMREQANIESLIELGIDYIGFIFYPPSPRYVGHDFEMPDIPNDIKVVGVFVNEDIEILKDKIQKYNLDAVQLHGDETPEYCNNVRSSHKDLTIIKAIGIKNKEDMNKIADYESLCDLFILDSKGKNYGGNGHTWDYSLLEELSLNSVFLLSGGIDETFDLADFSSLHSACIGVDLNSKFEIEPGLKDINKLKAFLTNG